MRKVPYHDKQKITVKLSNKTDETVIIDCAVEAFEKNTFSTKTDHDDDKTVAIDTTVDDLDETIVLTAKTASDEAETALVPPCCIDDNSGVTQVNSNSEEGTEYIQVTQKTDHDNDKTVAIDTTVDDLDETIVLTAKTASDGAETALVPPCCIDDNGEVTQVNSNSEERTEYIQVTQSNQSQVSVLTDFYTDIAQEPAITLNVGSVLKDRFLLTEVLGSGGMGTVFRATDSRRQEAGDLQSDVAIKVLNEGFKQNRDLFIALQREAKKTQQLAHPNIVTVYDFDRDGGNIYIVMEALQGKPLSDFIAEHKTGIPFKEAWWIIKGLSLALGYAHKKNIIHSDFKPGNVFVTDQEEIKVMDFGIASVAKNPDQENQQKTIFNARDLGALTPAYASLEMFLGLPPSPRDDIYALGCVCYELLTGAHPFDKLSSKEALNTGKTPSPIKGLGRRQQQAIMHALALEGHKRTASIGNFLDEIEPQSIFPNVLIGLAILVMTLSVSGYIYFYREIDLIDNQAIVLTEEQKLQVKDLLELAAIHLDVGYITAPSGSNALWAYRKVLKIDPYNKDAQIGLKRIADQVAEQASQLYNAGKYNESLAKIEAGLDAIPEHKQLLALKDKILRLDSRSLN